VIIHQGHAQESTSIVSSFLFISSPPPGDNTAWAWLVATMLCQFRSQPDWHGHIVYILWLFTSQLQDVTKQFDAYCAKLLHLRAHTDEAFRQDIRPQLRSNVERWLPRRQDRQEWPQPYAQLRKMIRRLRSFTGATSHAGWSPSSLTV